MPDEELINRWGRTATELDEISDDLGHIEMELTTRMEARGATAIDHPNYEVMRKEGTPSWDYGKLAGLRELVAPGELAAGFTPEHDEIVHVPDAWNMTRIKPLVKYGGNVAAIIKGARLPGRMGLSIKRKREA